MLNFSYNLSNTLRSNLQQIDSAKDNILLTQLYPLQEQDLRWNATIDRIYWALALLGEPPTKRQIKNAFNPQKSTKTKEKKIIALKNTHAYINAYWVLSPYPITSETLLELATLLKLTISEIKRENLTSLMDYLNTNPENAIINAAIAYIQLIHLFPQHTPLAQAVAYLILYKAGYNLKGLLVLEEAWKKDTLTLERSIRRGLEEKNITLWLEHFTYAMLVQSEKARNVLRSPRPSPQIHLVDLNSRQKLILSLLEEPGSTVSNRRVQQLFKVSQITASRDLAKLVSLDLVFPHGKGRSTVYTKV